MCRIDAPFGNITFDEKHDPKERFVQALDEFEIQGNLRTLLIKHFSDNWQNVFHGISELEEALSKTKQYDCEAEKSVAVLLYKNLTLQHGYSRYINRSPLRRCELLDFMSDVKNTYFHDSPFELYNFGMDKVTGNYYSFVSWLYGKDFCFSKEFFNDKKLAQLDVAERASVFWHFFHSIAHQFTHLDHISLLKELASLASLTSGSEPETKESLDIMTGFNFLKAWVKFDSQAARYPNNFDDFIYSVESPWYIIEKLISDEQPENEEISKRLRKWLIDSKFEFRRLVYVNADLNLISDEDKKQWAGNINRYYSAYTLEYIYSDYDYSQLPSEELDIRLSNAHHELCSELTPLQKTAWIKYSIDSDFQQALNKKITGTSLDECTDIWGSDEYIITLKKLLLEGLEELDIEGQLCVLSSAIPYRNKLSHNFYTELEAFWNNLFSHLIDLKDFPNKLIPDWTVVAVNRLKGEDILPYIDKSIGVIRGELLKAESKTQTKPYHSKLETLFRALDYCSTRKALRHRLLLMRSSLEPFSDETVSKVGSPLPTVPEGVYKWYDSLKQLSDTHYAYQTNGNREVTQDNYKQVQNGFYVNFSHELAEFCLSRLRLRKGEKAKDGRYDSSQVVEQSSIWRQGYLKALIELGFDLNGKVHKTVNFTKKSDPDKNVRAIASECYKVVRRHAKKNPSIQDIKRSIIAAEWWLLMCQRHELGLKVDHDEALKTRRNLMRNP